MTRDETSARKRDHIRLSLERDVGFREKSTWFEYVELVHQALPELDFHEVSTETTFLGRRFSMPLLIEGMTGGTPEAAEINGNLAEAAERVNIPMGVGSQRAAIADPQLEYTFRVARKRGPGAFLIANISGVQLAKEGVEWAEKAVEMIEADALAIHLNTLQEVVQPEGYAGFKGVRDAVEKAAERLGVPIIVKEIGCGISREAARMIEEAGASAIDVAGSGGTNWTLIEMMRAEGVDEEKKALAEVFLEWGIPTAASLIEVASTVKIEVIASGGVRTGLDIVKAMALGACMGGMAHPFLRPATQNPESVEARLMRVKREIQAALFLTGCRSTSEITRSKAVIFGPLLEWVRQRVGDNRHDKSL